METDPLQISTVFAITLRTPADKTANNNTPATEEKWDRIPMVMVDGVLYLETGHTDNDTRKCGTPDGKITSSVDGSEEPTADDQSNFGEGYEYQYGAAEGTIEIYMNDKWHIFATEEVRQQIQFPNKINTPIEGIAFTAQYIRTNGYVEGECYPKSVWITSPSEFQEYYEANKDKYDLDTYGTPGVTEALGFLDALASYDDSFFENQDLIVVVLEEPSGSIRHQVQSVTVPPSNLSRVQYFVQPTIERVVPEAGTDDMAQWHILIAISKEYGQLHSELQAPVIKEI